MKSLWRRDEPPLACREAEACILPAEDQLEAARALAEAQLELTRIREAKAAATPTGLDQMLDPEALKEPVRAWPL